MNQHIKHDFDQSTNRRGSGCVKWDCEEARDAIPMWVADMDFQVAQPIIDALQQRVAHGVFGYTQVSEDYYQAIIKWFEGRHAWQISREWIQYTSGVVPALSAVIKALTSPGDKVIIQTPVYNCFFSSIRNNGCLVEENRLVYTGETYLIDLDDLEKKASDPRVKLLVLCNPHNPAGRVWTKKELEKINEVCSRHQVKIVADEIHCELVMPSYQYTPFASVSQACLDNSITLNSPSKSFNIAGLQIANIICNNAEIRQKIDRAININEICDVNPFGVTALMAAYNECGWWIEQLCDYIHENYILLKDYLSRQLPEVKITSLEGTYLVWVDVRKLGLSSDDATRLLLEQGKVLVNSGTMYGTEVGEGFIRINIACPRQQLSAALENICKTFHEYQLKTS